jgi:hypothetical protein
MNNFFTPALLRQLPLAILSGLIISAAGFVSDGVHLPFLINILFSVGLGWMQPQKGWVLALVQVMSVLGGYVMINSAQLLITEHPDVTRFAAFLAAVPTLTGSFLGAFMKKAVSK